VKYKLSNDLTNYGFSVSRDSFNSSYYRVGLTAVFKKDLQSSPQDKYYATIDDCSIVTMDRTIHDMSNVS
jgi:hypothetical protein